MNHYEIVFLVHPDQKSDSEAILNKYCDQIKSSNGTIDRSENIGSRKLAYPIQDCYKANYFCIKSNSAIFTTLLIKFAKHG